MNTSRLIYSPEFYNVYENLGELLESLGSLNLDEKPDSSSNTKTIAWQVFSLSLISDISWKEGIIRIRESIEHSILVLKQYGITRKSLVGNNFKYTQNELEEEYDKLGLTVPEHEHSKFLIPLLSLKGYRIIGIFYYDDISCIPVNFPVLHTHTFMIEYKRLNTLNIAEHVMDLETRRITLYVDTLPKTIIMRASAFFAAIKPYIKLIKLEIKSKNSIKWKSKNYSDASNS